MDKRQQDDQPGQQQRPKVERGKATGGDGTGKQRDKGGIAGHGDRLWRVLMTGAMRMTRSSP